MGAGNESKTSLTLIFEETLVGRAMGNEIFYGDGLRAKAPGNTIRSVLAWKERFCTIVQNVSVRSLSVS